MPQVPVAQLKDYIGKELGHSEWLTIDQQRVDRFADCTGDHQFIHVDPEKAAQTPFGGTIAHGFLSLSLLPMLSGDLLVVPEGTRMGSTMAWTACVSFSRCALARGFGWG